MIDSYDVVYLVVGAAGVLVLAGLVCAVLSMLGVQ